MQTYDYPLVFFTVLSQVSVGLSFVGLARLRHGDKEGPPAPCVWWAAFAFIVVALIASIFHLGHPLHAPWALRHLAVAWLSREVLAFSIFAALVFFTAIMAHGHSHRILSWLTVISGAVALFTSGMTYGPPGMMAINNALPLVFFFITALNLGAAFGSWFVSDALQPRLTKVCTVGLALGLAFYLVVPCIWVSGGTVLQLTAYEWAISPWYWIHVLFGLLWPLMLVWKIGRIPRWLPIVMLIGDIMGRMTFFYATLGASVNIGNPY